MITPLDLASKAILAGSLCLCPGAILAAEQVMAPAIGAASNYGQSWFPETFLSSRDLPVTDYRDEIFWELIDQTNGTYRYEMGRTQYPDHLAQYGLGLSVMINNGHPGYDGGYTPHSPQAVAAFARFAGNVVKRFPDIQSVEVGNEMNSSTFAVGPGWEGDLQTRAASYVALLKATAEQVRQANPSVRILGGAAHSIPIAWFQALFENGADGYMDALVIHPYTVPPEQIRRQIALLRQLPDAQDMPIEVTEFGHKDAAQAPAHLVKNYCQMALAGVTRVIWYPLDPRGDGLTPLLDKDGAPTATGQTFRLVNNELADRPVVDFAPDPFTYACLFGDDRLVIWGAPRTVTLAHSDLYAVDMAGNRLNQPELMLSHQTPVIVLSNGAPIELASTLVLGTQQVIADSVDQFAYPGAGGDDPFERFVRQGDQDFALQTRPGQERDGVPWTPYLGTDRDGTVRATANWVLPAAWGSGPLEIVYRYRVVETGRATLRIDVSPSSHSVDGVILGVFRNNQPLETRQISTASTVLLEHLDLETGDILDFRIGPGDTPDGDASGFRVTILKDQP